MIDHDFTLLRLAFIDNNSAQTDLNSFYSRVVSSFDSQFYDIVDCWSNLWAEFLKTTLHEVELQICPVLTEVSWRIGLN